MTFCLVHGRLKDFSCDKTNAFAVDSQIFFSGFESQQWWIFISSNRKNVLPKSQQINVNFQNLLMYWLPLQTSTGRVSISRSQLFIGCLRLESLLDCLLQRKHCFMKESREVKLFWRFYEKVSVSAKFPKYNNLSNVHSFWIQSHSDVVHNLFKHLCTFAFGLNRNFLCGTSQCHDTFTKFTS